MIRLKFWWQTKRNKGHRPCNPASANLGQQLMQHIMQLTPAERTAWVLHDLFELPFDDVALARMAAALTKEGSLVSVAGGGDTVAALAHAGVTGDMTYISTAGGAFLEWMEGRELPGVAALSA